MKKAFFALVANGVRAAPLWESKKQSFVGKQCGPGSLRAESPRYPNRCWSEIQSRKLCQAEGLWAFMSREGGATSKFKTPTCSHWVSLPYLFIYPVSFDSLPPWLPEGASVTLPIPLKPGNRGRLCSDSWPGPPLHMCTWQWAVPAPVADPLWTVRMQWRRQDRCLC